VLRAPRLRPAWLSSGLLYATHDEFKNFFPLLKEVVVAESEIAITAVRKIISGTLALHPVVAAACSVAVRTP
jgi:hypothetical protein